MVIGKWSLQGGPGNGAAVARLAGEDATLADGFGAGLKGEDLVGAEVRLKIGEQVRGQGKTREQVLGDCLPAEIPNYGTKFVLFVEADAMVNGVEAVFVCRKEDVTALAVGVVDEQVKEGDGLEEQFVFGGEVEVVVVGVVFDVLLERAGAEGTVLTERGERDDVKAKRLADEVGGDFAQGEGAFLEIPKGLLALGGFVHGGIGFALVRDFDEEGVVRAERELTFDGQVAVLEGGR